MKAWHWGDLDGDGDLDAFLANWVGGDSVWLNQGGDQGGTEGEFVDSGQTLGSGSSMDVTLVDVNDDTLLDAVVAKFTATNGEVWLNDGSGSFTLSSADLDSSASYAIASDNLDGDPIDDLFFGNFSGNRVYLTTGCRELARFDVEARQNLAGQHQYPWVQIGDASLPVLLNFVPNSALNVLAGI